MELGILGPLEVRANGRAIELGGVKPRALLAMLVVHANEPVNAERLAVALWGEDVPPSAVKTVQVYVARLRKALEDPDVLATTPAGYCLQVGKGELDAERFERQVAVGREALAAGRGEDAAAQLRQALALWRGPPLADLASAPFAPAEIARLEEQRLEAVELRVEADLTTGRHAELVGELQQLTTQHAWRERLHAQLMLALYRSGRQADALDAYRRARLVLVEQLGIEPGAALTEIQQAILAHDPGIDAPSTSGGAGSDDRVGPGAAGDVASIRRLPAPPNRTVGREHELAEITERLCTGSVRLLTLTGPGGVGKTRLAQEAARTVEPYFADGAHFVSLAAVTRPDDVPAVIGGTLGATLLQGESHAAAVQRFLAAKQLLLVTDNFEHLLSAAPFIGDLVAGSSGLTVLATSRESLSLRVEQRYPVPPLALPDLAAPEDPHTLAGVAAVALFTERARALDPAFELCNGDDNAAAVAELCRRVDGLPLALELAAARCALLSPREIADRLDTALGTGAGARDAPPRQQTLRATIEWSHDLLSDDEQACFARFAVFAGGATVEAAESITGGGLDTLDRLVAKSLLVRPRQAGSQTRLTMLETIREFAGERLAAAADAHTVRERHHQHFLVLAQRHGSNRAVWGPARKHHLAQLDADRDNLDAALAWAVAQASAEPALALCAALSEYWVMRQRYRNALDWIDRALTLPGTDAHPALHAQVLCAKSWALWPVGRGDEIGAVTAEAEAIARSLSDPLLLWRVLQARAAAEADQGRLDVADAVADEALRWAHVARDDWAVAMATFAKAMAADSAAQSRELANLAASRLEGVGNVYHLAGLLASAAYSALAYGDDQHASEYIRRAIPVTRALDNPHMWMLLSGNAGLTALLTGDTDAACEAFADELRCSRVPVALPFASEALRGLAALATVGDELDRAARLSGAADAHRGGDNVDKLDARLHDTFFAPARIRLGPDAWDAAVREGAALSFEEAIAYALDESAAGAGA